MLNKLNFICMYKKAVNDEVMFLLLLLKIIDQICTSACMGSGHFGYRTLHVRHWLNFSETTLYVTKCCDLWVYYCEMILIYFILLSVDNHISHK